MGILTEDMKRLVTEQRLGFVATVCPDGTPNLSPKGTTEINVVDPMVRKGYRFKGVASVLTEGVLFEQIVDFYRAKRNLEEGLIRSVVLVKIDEAMPLISPAYDQGQSEDQVREKWQRYLDSLQRNIPATRRHET